MDLNPSRADWNNWYFDEADYFLKGTGTYAVIGTSKSISGRLTSIDTFDADITKEVHLIITKTKEGYEFVAEIPQSRFSYVNTWAATDPADHGTENREGDGGLPSNFAGNLSGTDTFHQWPLAENIAGCDDYEGATGTITWSFE